jgi:hypothetical protein
MRVLFQPMPARITTATPEQIPELTSFLREVFDFPPDAPSLHPELMRWKYFDPHPWWPNGRSYILENSGSIAAHGCVTPVRFVLEGRVIDSAQVIDWAASRNSPGGGLMIYRHCLSLIGALLAIGGSDITRRLIPSLKWFAKRRDMTLYARPLHAMGYFHGRRNSSARTAAKIGRNFAWSVWPRLPRTGQWRCDVVPKLEHVSTPSGSFIVIERTSEWLNFLLRCPTARFQPLLLSRSAKPCGHALVSFIGPQIRIVDFAIDLSDSNEWLAALSAVIRWAASQPGVAEIAAGSSLQFFHSLYTTAGMRVQGTWPVHVADPKGLLSADTELEINFLIGDASFLYDRNYPLWC